MSAVEEFRAATEREIGLGWIPADRADEYREVRERTITFGAAVFHDGLVALVRAILAWAGLRT